MSIIRPSERGLYPDVAIIGAGLAGTLAAILLSRQGLRVVLIDPHPIYPPDFRAEQIVGPQVAMFRQLGLLDILVQDTLPVGQAVAMRRGRVIGTETAPHYGIHYADMVNRARRALPPAVQIIKGKVTDIALNPERQTVWLCDGRSVQSRLVVLATGLGHRLANLLNIEHVVLREAQSLTFGFDFEVGAPSLFRSSVLVVYGEQLDSRIDYLTVFAIENKLRANLFTYHERRDPWVRPFLQEPSEMLQEALPHLQQTLHGFRLTGPVQMRVNDLTTVKGHGQHGLVLIGDAFQTSCPAAGTGIGRLLHDIDRLCHEHVPRWFATSGMGCEKIRSFYHDPVKQARDAEALRVAAYRRSFVTEAGIGWILHRQRVALQQRLRLMAKRVSRHERKPKLADELLDAMPPLIQAPSPFGG
jgi:2-polyprenyl-6-methoxyphenol hydroxylase-like FAD-dependent oxidoreductase